MYGYHELLRDWATTNASNEPPIALEDVSGVLPARLTATSTLSTSPPDCRLGLDDFPVADAYTLLVPRSLDLFESYLSHVAATAPHARLAAAFLTRHFTPGLLEITHRYAATVAQSRAHRKARLLLLENFRPDAPRPETLRRTVEYASRTFHQHYGVFSAGRVDYGTQLLLDEWPDLPPPASIVDACCGSGVIATILASRYPDAEVSGFDVFYPAVASARENLPRGNFFASDRFPTGKTYDLIAMNPPFHTGRRVTVGPALELFRRARVALNPGGKLIIVANRHLGYAKHLKKDFGRVEVVAENDKFVILRAGVE